MTATAKMSPNREQWLRDLAHHLEPIIQATIPSFHTGMIRVTCGWPSSGGLGRARRVMGECWEPECTPDGVCEIFISPTHDDPAKMAGTLLHEMIHAAVGPNKKHGPVFKRACKDIGMVGKATSNKPGQDLQDVLDQLLAAMPPYPHRGLTPKTRKKQGTRMLKFEAVGCCGYVLRTTRKWYGIGAPQCPHGVACELQNPEALDEAPS